MYKNNKKQLGHCGQVSNLKTSPQKGSVVPGIILLVFILMLALFFFVIALGTVKSKFETVCNWRAALNIILGADKQKTLDTLCKLGGGASGGAGASGAFGCAGTLINVIDLESKLQTAEGLRLYPYKDSEQKCTIGYGHNLEGGSNANFTSIVTDKTPQDFISSCCPDSKTECTTPHPTITQEQADAIFQKDLVPIEADVKDILKHYDSLPGNAKQILVEIYFQTGAGNFKKFKDLFAALDQEDPSSNESTPNYQAAAQAIRDSNLPKNRAEDQAKRMENIRCEIAVIPPAGQNPSCDLEKNCESIDKYPGSDGGPYDICKAVADKIPLKKIDDTLITVSGKPKYLYSIMADQLAEASTACNKCFFVTSAYRSCKQQQNMIDSGNYGTIAAAGHSNHNGGQGIDINGSGEYECNMVHCSQKLVKFLGQYGFTHFNGCGIPQGDFYVGPKKSQADDCVHFSPDGK